MILAKAYDRHYQGGQQDRSPPQVTAEQGCGIAAVRT